MAPVFGEMPLSMADFTCADVAKDAPTNLHHPSDRSNDGATLGELIYTKIVKIEILIL